MDWDKVRDWVKRAAWTALYLLVSVFLTNYASADPAVTPQEVAKASLIAAALVIGKQLLVSKFGDPDAVRGALADLGLRAFHTFWQTAIALILATDFSADAIKAALVAAGINTLKGVALPPLPGGGPERAQVEAAEARALEWETEMQDLRALMALPRTPEVGDHEEVEDTPEFPVGEH